MTDPRQDLDLLLDRCLARIQAGEATLEDCLRQHAQQAEELAPLLDLALRAQGKLAPPGPSATFLSTSPTRLRNRLRAASPPPAPARPRRRRRLRLRPAFALLGLVLAFSLLATSVGVASASSHALPGDALYGVKLGLEEMRLAISLSAEGDATLIGTFASERLREAERLVDQGRASQVAIALAGYEALLDQLLELAAQVADQEGAGVLQGITRSLQAQEQDLEKVRAKAPPAAQPALERALEHSHNGKEMVEGLRRGGAPEGVPPGQWKRSMTPDGDQPAKEPPGKSGEKTKGPKKEKDKPGKKTPQPEETLTPTE